MGNLNSAPNANRVRIGFFGSRNAGKSSLVNAFAGQEVSIVSDTPGTTTDPVVKAMELLPVGAVTLVDTAGADDGGELGSMRVKRTDVELDRCDVALLVADATKGLTLGDKELLEKIRLKKIPFLVVFNKCDLTRETGDEPGAVRVSAKTGENINRLREAVAALAKTASSSVGLFDGILDKEDVVLFVTPIDASAPKGRMILPQVRALRDVLDKKAVCVFCQTEQLPAALSSLKNSPKLVVTDSQAFGAVKKMLPESQRLTSFSILLAYVNGILSEAVKGAAALSELKDGDTVLIAEGCTHHRQCEDIGTVKLPKWIEEFSGRKLNFRFTSGNSFPRKSVGDGSRRALRRLYAQRKGNGAPSGNGGKGRSALLQLRNSHCAYQRYFEAQFGNFPRACKNDINWNKLKNKKPSDAAFTASLGFLSGKNSFCRFTNCLQSVCRIWWN